MDYHLIDIEKKIQVNIESHKSDVPEIKKRDILN